MTYTRHIKFCLYCDRPIEGAAIKVGGPSRLGAPSRGLGRTTSGTSRVTRRADPAGDGGSARRTPAGEGRGTRAPEGPTPSAAAG